MGARVVTTTAVIIQARQSSTRLPGKGLADIAGKPALARVLERCLKIEGADVIVCALPDGPRDDVLEVVIAEAADYGRILVYRGPEDDVLARFLGAAEMVAADVIMRITADCPLIDAEVCSEVLATACESFSDSVGGINYCSNCYPERTYPQGLDCEVFTIKALRAAHYHAATPYDREHVTPWIQENLNWSILKKSGENLSHLRWTLDYADDLNLLRKLFGSGLPISTMDEVLEAIKKLEEST